MRRISVIAVLLILAGTIPVGGEELYTLRGTALDDDHAPVRGAVACLPALALRDTTDETGAFRLDRIPAGEYTLVLSQPYLGFRDIRRTVTLPADSRRPLAIAFRGRTYATDEVVVTAPAAEGSDPERDSPAMVTVSGRSEFEGRAATVAEVIAATPGATVRTLGGLGDYTEVSLRGANASQIEVYLDGMLLNDASGGAVDLAGIPLAQAQSIEVWRGGTPARFGGNAIGGAVNIRTLDFGASGGAAGIGYGSFNTVRAEGLRRLSLGRSRLLLSAGYSSAENDFRFMSDNGTAYNDTDDFWTRRRNDAFRSLNALAKFRMPLGESSFLDISEHIISNDKELPGVDIVQDSKATLATVRNLLQLRLAVAPFLRDALEFEPSLSHIHTREHYRDTDNSVGWGAQDNIYQTDRLHLALPLTTVSEKHFAITLTPETSREWFRPDYRLQTAIPLSCDRERYAAVLDGSARFFRERLTLTGSLSRERSHSSFAGQPSPQNTVTPGPRTYLLTNRHLGTKYALGKHLALRANYGDVTRVPGFPELFGDRGTTVSNPDLKPEHTFRRDIGIRGGGASGPMAATLECAYFSTLNRNLIQWYMNDAGFLFADNVGESYIRGTELIGTLRIGRVLSCAGNWTFQRSRVTVEENVIYVGKQLPNRPDGYGNLRIELPLRFAAPFWNVSRKGEYYLDRANQAHMRYPGRTIHDIGVTVPLSGGRRRITVEARNVTGEHTFDTEGMPLPGRAISCTMTWGNQ